MQHEKDAKGLCGDAGAGEAAGRDRSRGRPPVMSAEDRARRIFEALDTVFERDGLAGTSIAAIAAEAGMSKRTLYAIFPDRDALFAAYLDNIRNEFIHTLTSADLDLPLEERLRRLLAPMPRPRPSGLPLTVLGMALAGGGAPHDALRACLSGFVQRDRALIRAELDRAVRRGEARIEDTSRAAAILEAMVRPSIGDILMDPVESSTSEAKHLRFEAGLRMFLRAVTPQD